MNKRPRALVFRFAKGDPTYVPVSDDTVFKIDGQTFAISGVESLELEDVDLAKLETEDAFDAIDLGTPVAEWGKRA